MKKTKLDYRAPQVETVDIDPERSIMGFASIEPTDEGDVVLW